ncbi:MAG: (2Fe-2S)-binding protein, partial [Frankia sp.]
LGCWATAGIVPDLSPSHLRVQPRPAAPVRLMVDQPAGWRVERFTDAAGLLHEVVIEHHLRPYFTALHDAVRLPVGLLWGNAASALIGATRVLITSRPHAPPAGRPGPVPPATAAAGGPPAVTRMAADLLETPPLAGTTVHAATPAGRLELTSVVRRSCCLFYRVPGGGTCGDCPLSPTPERTRR